MSQVEEFVYEASDTLRGFHADDSFIRGILGPLGSGKSHGCVMEMFFRALEIPPQQDGVRRSRSVIIRSTYRELKDTTVQTWNAVLPAQIRHWRESDMSSRITLPLPDGTKVDAMFLFRALDRPQDVAKLLSLELTNAWINEARETPKAILDMLQGRVGRYPAKRDCPDFWFGIIMDTNPCDVTDWWYKMFELAQPDEWRMFRQPGGLTANAENIENLPGGEQYYTRLTAAHTQDWIDIYVKGNYGFTVEGRPIYPEYNDQVHTIEGTWEPVPGRTIHVGIDFGLTPAALFGQEDPFGSMVWFRELVTEDMGAVRFGEELSKIMRKDYGTFKFNITGDPAGEQRSQVDERTPFDVLHAMGIPADKAYTNDFTLRREGVVKAMRSLTIDGKPGLVLVKDQVPMARKGMMGGYSYRRMNISGPGEYFQDKPDKNIYSHVCEAGQYLMCGAGITETVIQTDLPVRPTRVNASRQTGVNRTRRRTA